MVGTAPPTAGYMTSAQVASGGWCSIATVARLLGWDQSTINRRIKAGTIPANRLGPNGHYRIPKVWVDAELAKVRVIRRKPQ